MKYLILSEEMYNDYIIGSEFEEELNLNLPNDYKKELYAWNKQYKKLIYFSDGKQDTKEIERLDKLGIELTKKLKKILGDAKIKYYSSGKGEYIYHC